MWKNGAFRSTRGIVVASAIGAMSCGGQRFSGSNDEDAATSINDATVSPSSDAPTSPVDDAIVTDPSHPADASPVIIDAPATTVGTDVKVVGSPYRELVLSEGPLAYWRMGIASGSVVRDESGHQNDLLLQGSGHVLRSAGAIHGDPDTAIRFDGVGSYAIATNARKFDFPAGAAFTIECWARREDVADAASAAYFQHLIGSATGNPPNRNGYLLYVLPAMSYSSFEYDALNAGQIGLQGALAPLATYAHYVGVFDGKTVSLYVDATLSSKVVDGTIAARTSELSVGREFSSGRYYFSGAIDEIAVYDKALTSVQIIRHHDVALGR